MAKEFTDYIPMILESGERVYHLRHIRTRKDSKWNGKTIEVHGHHYLLNLDRAYRVNWAPWKKLIVKKPYWKNFYKPLVELTRSKKVGLLLYQEKTQEPGPFLTKEIKTPIGWACPICNAPGKSESGVKRHMTIKHKGTKLAVKVEYKGELITIPTFKPIEPMHISRIHQPSGVMKG